MNYSLSEVLGRLATTHAEEGSPESSCISAESGQHSNRKLTNTTPPIHKEVYNRS